MGAGDSGIEQLLGLLDEAYKRKSWHGTNLRGSVRGLTAEQAAWRARPGGRSIAEIVVHCAYWKYAVRRRLRREKRGSFPLKGSNWFKLIEPFAEAAWRGYVALLDEQHETLAAAIAALRPRDLAASPRGSQVDNAKLIRGVALHDVYHAGQIQTIKGCGRQASA